MRLRTLELQNYRRFQEAVVDFPEGVIAIVGPNGAGKSTLLEAIGWCLYGNEAARTDKDLLRRQAAAPGEDVRVRLEFELDGQRVAVTRRLRGRSQQPEAQVEVEGTLVVAPGANSAEASARHVAKLLGMDRRGFLATVFAQQGDLSALSDAKPGDRKRLILGLLGIDELDAAIASARTRKRDAAIRLDVARTHVARLADLEKRLAKIRTDASTAAKERDACRQDLSQSLARWTQRDETQKALAARRERHRELRARLEGLQRALRALEEARVRTGSEIQLLERRLQDLSRSRTEFERFSDFDQRWAEAEQRRAMAERRKHLQVQLERATAEVARWSSPDPHLGTNGSSPSSLEAGLAKARDEAERLHSDLIRHEAHAGHVEQERRRIQSEDVDAGHRVRELASMGPEAPCPVCDRALGDAVVRLTSQATASQSQRMARLEALAEDSARHRRAMAELGNQLTTARTLVQQNETQLARVRAHLDSRRVAEGALERATMLVSQLQAEVNEVPAIESVDVAGLQQERAERDRLAQTLARLETETSRLPRLQSELRVMAGSVQENRTEIEAASRELGDLRYVDGSWETAAIEAQSEADRVRGLESRVAILEERFAGLETQRTVLEQDVAALGSAREEVERLAQTVRIGELLAADRGDAGLLPEFKTHLIGRVRPALARTAGSLVAEMTQGRYTELVLDEDYTVRLHDGANAWPIERFSGGEADVVHLALRLAVSELLAHSRHTSRLQFVALDEVLAGQDEVRRRNVLASLRGLASHFRNVLLVTHLDEVRERVDHVLQVVPRPDGTSEVRCSWTDAV